MQLLLGHVFRRSWCLRRRTCVFCNVFTRAVLTVVALGDYANGLDLFEVIVCGWLFWRVKAVAHLNIFVCGVDGH